MSLADTNMRGACLNCRFAVNGIQKALRSFGTTLRRFDMTELLSQFHRGQRLVLPALRATQILTDWTNVSTVTSTVKGILMETAGLKCAPEPREKLVQSIGPQAVFVAPQPDLA